MGDKAESAESLLPTSSTGPWDGICIDDGSGKNVYYIGKTGNVMIMPINLTLLNFDFCHMIMR
jgi:hypothetical protein